MFLAQVGGGGGVSHLRGVSVTKSATISLPRSVGSDSEVCAVPWMQVSASSAVSSMLRLPDSLAGSEMPKRRAGGQRIAIAGLGRLAVQGAAHSDLLRRCWHHAQVDEDSDFAGAAAARPADAGAEQGR